MTTLKRTIRAILITALLAIVASRTVLAQQYYWSNLAGMPGGSGILDGTGLAAQFNTPSSVAVDRSRTVYVADRGNHTIRKVTASGVVTTLAGSPGVSGTSDGQGSAARFNAPSGVAVDGGGNLYVADSGNYTIRKVAPDGTVTTLAGSPGEYGIADGTGSGALFGCPTGLAVDGDGNVYVADTDSHTIRKVTSAGVVTTFAGTAGQLGTADGMGSAAQFNQPNGVAVDGSGFIYIADTFNHSIRKITPTGEVTTFAGNAPLAGILDGTGTLAMFNFPHSISVDGNGNVFVADSFNHTIRKVTSAGVVTTLAGSAGTTGVADGIGTVARFNTPSGVAVDGSGIVFVADSYNHSIRKVTGDWGVVTTFVGSVSQSAITSGTGSAARFKIPNGVGVDASGNSYVADASTIRKVTATGVVTTIAGASGGLLDGNGTAALFNNPCGIAVASSSNIYVADTFNNIIRKITLSGTTWTTKTIGGLVVTGSGYGSTLGGIPGRVDGTGTSAQFSNPSGIAVDSSGVLYIADTYNQTIRQMTLSGTTWTVVTLTGTTAQTGTADGVGSAVRFSSPFGIAVDSGSNVYVADCSNHTIRKMTISGSSWTVTTLAGSPGVSGSADGIGNAARFNNPAGLSVDSGSNVYVADSGNSAIRKVTPDGTVVTLGGMPGVASGADGVGSVALFNEPCGVAVNGTGFLYVADSGNNRISLGSCAGSGTASLINGTGATLNGAAFPNGLATTVNFQYGTSLSYTLSTAGQSIGSGTDFVAVTAKLTGLTPNTTYHYRIKMVSTSGTFYGIDQTFTTPPVVVPAITSAATATGTNSLAFPSYQITADNSTTWFGASGLPVGLGLNPATGIISGTPTVTGTFPVTIAANNIIGTGTKTLTISLLDMPLPSFTSRTEAVAIVGCPLYFTITAAPYVSSYSATGLPQWASLDTATGLISGVPTASGTFTVNIGAQNNSGISSGTLTLTSIPAYYWSNFAGKISTSGTANGGLTDAQFYNPNGIVVDSNSNIYVADTSNSVIRKIAPTGVVTTLAGSPRVSGTSDGTGSAARFNSPYAVAVDSGSNLYIADTYNHSIRKITPAGVVTTLAGLSGSTGSVSGTGSVARFYYPYGIAVDSGSNVYVADSSNQIIRKITPAGVVTTLAGTAGTSGSVDGTGSAARFSSPRGVAVDSAKNVYVGDASNYTIRKITSGGVVTTLAGTAGSSSRKDGIGSLARFKFPVGIAIDSGTNLYITDSSGYAIRRMSVSGSSWAVTTIAGGTYGLAEGAGSAAQFSNPYGVTVDTADHVYVADTYNQRISIGASQLPPSITSALVASGTAGVPFSYSITGSNNPTSYGAIGLPSGLAINTATGIISGTPTVSGSYAFTINARSLGGPDNETLTLILRNTLGAWKALQFTSKEMPDLTISSDTATPARDGISNLMKYALNLAPKNPSVTGLPIIGTTTVSGTNYLTLTYAPDPLVSDITYTVEVSGDLQTWNSGPGFTALVNTGTASSITVKDAIPMDSATKRFIHLKVNKP